MKSLLMAALPALSAAPRATGAPGLPAPPLRLTAEIVGRRYCAGEKTHILQLSVRLRYQNTGGRRLIVYRGKNFFYQTRVRGGSDAGAGGPYEVVVLNSRFNDSQPEAVGGRKPGGAFVTLPPGGVYETSAVVGVGVTPDGSARARNSIRPGEHTLQIITSSWYESRKLAEELRDRWRGHGELWIDPAASEPLTFAVGREGPSAGCR